MNIMVDKTHMLAHIFILVYPHNRNLHQIIEAISFLYKKWMGRHMVDLYFNSGSP